MTEKPNPAYIKQQRAWRDALERGKYEASHSFWQYFLKKIKDKIHPIPLKTNGE